MKKQQAIQLFKDFCNDPANDKYRESCVGGQHQRNIWDANFAIKETGVCRIRIAKTGLQPTIIICEIKEGEIGKENLIICDDLSIQEYTELQKMFIGNYKFDLSLMKQK